MSGVTTRLGLGDLFYTFDPNCGIIYRHTVSSISINPTWSPSGTTASEVIYISSTKLAVADTDALTEEEVTDVANNWLVEKSTSMFTSVGL